MNVHRRDFLLLMTLATAAVTPAFGQAAPPAVGSAESAQSTVSIPDFSGIWGHPYWPSFERRRSAWTLTTMIPPFMQKISAQEIAPTPFHPITPNFFRNAFRSLNRSLASFCSSGSLSNTNLCGEPLVMTNILTGRS
jgi:hypothetical protein